MSPTRVIPRLAVAIGTALAMLWIASPAFAADAIDTSISGLSSSISAGARSADTFRTSMQNKTKVEIQPVKRVLVLRLAGITPDKVRILRGPFPLGLQASASGEVRATDPLQVRLAADGKTGDESRQDYGIQFLAGAPNGKAELIFQAFRGDQLLGSTSKDLTVKGGVSPTASHTPTPSATSSTQTEAAPAVDQTTAVDAIASKPSLSNVASGGGVPVIFYILGAVLVGMGGVILWMLFRPRPALVAGADPNGPYEPAGPYAPVRPVDPAPTLGYSALKQPRHAANAYPTTVMPAVHDPSAPPPPPVDPWASQAGGADTTRGFGPPRQ